MLHEIFKGMDNASETINDNFQNGSIVEHNLDEPSPTNGYYVKYGNGWMICFRELTINQAINHPTRNMFRTAIDTARYTLPKEFAKVLFADASAGSAIIGWGAVNADTTAWTDLRFYSPTDTQTVESAHLFAMGIAKD